MSQVSSLWNRCNGFKIAGGGGGSFLPLPYPRAAPRRPIQNRFDFYNQGCLFIFRRGPTSSEVKNLQFSIDGKLLLVRFSKNNTPEVSI